MIQTRDIQGFGGFSGSGLGSLVGFKSSRFSHSECLGQVLLEFEVSPV